MAESKDTNDTVENENSTEVEVKPDPEQAENTEAQENPEKPVESEKTQNGDDNTVKAEPEEEPSDELLNKIKKQVEFYFGNVNMQRDKFLNEQTKLDDGWVPMSVMLNFKMLASLSKNVNHILKALEDSDLIEISADRKKIRRSPEKPLPVYDETYKKEQEARTVYLKGFPLNSTISTLKTFFESTDSVENIIMRRYKKGKEFHFKGSIFLLFKTLDDAKAFVDQESIKYNDTELIKMWMSDYVASKEKEKEERRQKKADNAKGTKNNKNNVPERQLPKGCIIQISNVPTEFNKDKIKEKFISLECEVAFVDYITGNTEGWVRFYGENSAVDLLKKLDSNTVKIDESEITCTVLEGAEEEAYLKKIKEGMANRRANFRRDRGRNARKGFKRRHSPQRNDNAKKLHVEDA